MKFFLLAESIEILADLTPSFLFDGVVISQPLSGDLADSTIEQINHCAERARGPLILSLGSNSAEAYIAKGRQLAGIAPNIAIGLPLAWSGVEACKTLTDEGHMVCMSGVSGAAQALLAAKAGATYIAFGKAVPASEFDLISDLMRRSASKAQLIAKADIGPTDPVITARNADAICLTEAELSSLCPSG